MELNPDTDITKSNEESNKDWKIKCPICLGNIINNSFTESCCHEYCFTCLSQWSKVKAECPMCKKSFKKIMHNVRSNSDFDTYEVVQQDNPFPPLQTIDHIDFHSFRGYRTTQRHARRQPARPPTQQARDAAALTFRRLVYSTHAHVLPPPPQDAQGGTRDISSAFLRSNPACLHRLYPWLYRDLEALGLLRRADALVSHLISGALVHDIDDARFLASTRAHFGPSHAPYAPHFVHELLGFARSPVDAHRDYDRCARYRLDGGGALVTCETYAARAPIFGPEQPDLPFENAASPWTNVSHFVMIPPPMVSYNFSLTSTDPFVRISHSGLIDVNDINNSLIETYINDQHHHHHILPTNAPAATRISPREQGEQANFGSNFPTRNPVPSGSSSGLSEVQIVDDNNAANPRARATGKTLIKSSKPLGHSGPRKVFPIFERAGAPKSARPKACPPPAHDVKREVGSVQSSFCEVLDALPPIKYRNHRVHTVVEYSSSPTPSDDDNMPLDTLKRVWKGQGCKREPLPQAMVQPGTSKQYNAPGPALTKKKDGKRKARGKPAGPAPKTRAKTRPRRGSKARSRRESSAPRGGKGASESGDSVCEVYRSPVFEMASYLSHLPLIDHQERTMAWVRCYTQWWQSKDREVQNGFYDWTNEEFKLIWSQSKLE